MENATKIPKKKPFWKRFWFYAALVLFFIISSIAFAKYRESKKPLQYETAKVEKGTLVQTVDATGNVNSANELDLRFEMNGTIKAIYKNTNAQVKKGDVIAELSAGDLEASVARASAQVTKAKADLNKQIAGDTTAYLSGLEAQLAKAKADLSQIEATNSKVVSNAESDLKNAENNLKLSEGGEQSQIVQDAYQDLKSLLFTIQDGISSGLTEADNILGMDNKLVNDEFETYLGISNVQTKSIAENRYYTAKNAKNSLDTSIGNLTTNNTLDTTANQASSALLSMKDLLIAVSNLLDSTLPVGNLSITELSTYKTDIQTERTNISTQYTNLINQIQAVSTAKNSYTTYKIAYDKALLELTNIQRKTDADKLAYEALVRQAEANYNDAKNPPREVDLATYRAMLLSAQADLQQAISNRNKAKLTAPTDGVIGKMERKIGEYVSSQDIVAKLLSPHFEVKVDIPETDIIKITLGDTVTVTLDAFGEDVKFEAKVDEIEKGETIIQDVVYYTVTVTLTDTKEYEILNGMTADAIFYTAKKENVLFIPQRVVRSEGTNKYVRVLENNISKDIPVTLGLRGDGGMVEILSGLTEGQDVIIRQIEEK
ncbi:MAG: efflux RND transporter periplasmic adaptor subunit [Candidatus Magasanikbacteria bacterium]